MSSTYCSSVQYARPSLASLFACSHSARREGDVGDSEKLDGGVSSRPWGWEEEEEVVDVEGADTEGGRGRAEGRMMEGWEGWDEEAEGPWPLVGEGAAEVVLPVMREERTVEPVGGEDGWGEGEGEGE